MFRTAFRHGLVMVVSGRHDGGVDPFHVVHVGYIGSYELSARLHTPVFVLPRLQRLVELRLNSLGHVCADSLDHLRGGTVRQRLVGQRYDRFDRLVLDAGIWGALSRTVQPHKRFDKVPIG